MAIRSALCCVCTGRRRAGWTFGATPCLHVNRARRTTGFIGAPLQPLGRFSGRPVNSRRAEKPPYSIHSPGPPCWEARSKQLPARPSVIVIVVKMKLVNIRLRGAVVVLED